METIGRRVFVRRTGLAFLALGLPPDVIARPLLRAYSAAAGRKTLVCIFQRGAVDGLSMVVPFGDPAYGKARRATLIPSPSRGSAPTEAALDLDGFFGLHPAMAPLEPLYRSGGLSVVHAVGSPHPTRSHFDAQDFMESAVPGRKSVEDGWLNRVLQETGPTCEDCRGRTLADGARHAEDHRLGQVGAVRGIAMGSALPRSLRGAHPALSIPDLARFGDSVTPELQRLYRSLAGDLVSGAADDAFEAVRLLESIDAASYRPANDAVYPQGQFGRALRQIAQLIKADVGVEVAFADLGGWDTHVAQGGVQGALARNLAQLSQGIRAFHDDLGDRMEDVVVLTMSEFGRTVAENGSGGTDHGHANCMLALGGGVRGGRVLGEWPGLEREQLHDARDLALTTDFRDIFAEVAERHLGVRELDRVFPEYPVDPTRYRGILG